MSISPISAGKTTSFRYCLPLNDDEFEIALGKMGLPIDERAKKPSPPKLPNPPVPPKLLTINHFEDFIPEELLDEDSKSKQPFFADHLCGINWIPVRDPVYDVRFKGHIYERRTIHEWLKNKQVSPLNQDPMTEDHLADDVQLKNEVDQRLNAWIAKKNEPILKRHREALRLHEQNVQEILSRHNEAMHRYESAIKAQDETDEKEQIPDDDFEEEPRNIPYGAGLARLRDKERNESANHSSESYGYGVPLSQRDWKVVSLPRGRIPTDVKVHNVAMDILGDMAHPFAKVHDVADCVAGVNFSNQFDQLISFEKKREVQKLQEDGAQKYLSEILVSMQALERAKRAS